MALTNLSDKYINNTSITPEEENKIKSPECNFRAWSQDVYSAQ